MAIKWVDDDAARVVLAKAGILFTEKTIAVKDINRKLSAENRARKTPLDESRLPGITSSMKQGVPIPKIVVRDTPDGFVVAGGNHRLNAMPPGETSLPVHVLDCTDSEFEVAVRLLNGYVGSGITKSERVESAVDAVNRLGLPQKLAIEMYGVTKGDMQVFIGHAKAEALLSSLQLKGVSRLTRSHIKALGELCGNTNVLRAAAQATITNKLTTDELTDLARVARMQPTEAAQVRVFEETMAVADKPDAVVPRKIKKRFLQAVGTLRGFVGSETWSSLEIKADEIQVIKSQVREARDILNSLLKVSG